MQGTAKYDQDEEDDDDDNDDSFDDDEDDIEVSSSHRNSMKYMYIFTVKATSASDLAMCILSDLR